MSQNPGHTETTETPENRQESGEDPTAEAAGDLASDFVTDEVMDEAIEEVTDGIGDNVTDEITGDGEEPAADGEPSPEDEVLRLEAELASTRDKLLRAVAETENVRRRAQRDKEDTARYSVSNFARALVAVADNLRRALDSVDESTRKEVAAVENLMIGVEMTERELLAAFERNNIRCMDPVGQRFDPHFHEAMFEYDNPDLPAGTVGQVIETGYMIYDRPLRPAKVGITKGGPKAESKVEPAAPCAPSEAPDEAGDPAAYEGKTGKTGKPGEHIDEEL